MRGRGRGITSAQLEYWIVKDISSMRTFFEWVIRGKFGRLTLHNCQGDLGSWVSTTMTNHHLKRHSCDGRVVKALDSKSNGVSPRRFEPCSQRSEGPLHLWETDTVWLGYTPVSGNIWIDETAPALLNTQVASIQNNRNYTPVSEKIWIDETVPAQLSTQVAIIQK